MVGKVRFPTLLLGILLIGIGTVGCGATKKAPIEDRKIDIVATTGMIGDIVEQVGGDRVAVRTLMGPGVDPHTYKSKESDLKMMTDADVIFYNGLHLEGQMAHVFERSRKRTLTVAVTKDLDSDNELRRADNHEGPHDPHVWFDVRLWMRAVETVCDTLVDMDPTHADYYKKNTERYLGELRELHEYVLQQAKNIPREQRILVTAHDAFYYFGRAYEFEVRGLQGISTAARPSPKDVDDLATFIVEKQVKAIFVESSVSEQNSRSVQEAVKQKGKGFEVKVVNEALFSDALGEAGTSEGTYIGMVRHNIDTIVKELQP